MQTTKPESSPDAATARYARRRLSRGRRALIGVAAVVVALILVSLLFPYLMSWPARSRYDDTLAAIAQRQAAFAAAATGVSQEEVEQYWMEVLEDDLFPAWYGTPWSFSGVAERPSPAFLLTPSPLREPQRSIACGHFVGVVLRDLGFDLDRFAVGRLASRRIIETLVSDRRLIRRFYEEPIDELTAQIRELGHGVYVVGLDFHTGFLLANERGVFFIHSTAFPPFCVVKEPLWRSLGIRTSKVVWVARISGDKSLVSRWAHRTRITVPRS